MSPPANTTFPRAAAWAALLAVGGLTTGGAACALPALVVPKARAPFHSDDPALRRAPLFLYPARGPGGADSVRAFVFYLGSDVGFWRAHERVAEMLSARGYAVAGVDVRRLLGKLPGGPARAGAYLARVDSLLVGARAALGAAAAPLVVAGHSVGGELAVWTAARLREPGFVGVVAMSPGARGHLSVGFSDLLGREPRGADSFAVDSEVARVRRETPAARIALVRGTKDDFRSADPGIIAAGARRFVAEGQGHSLLDQRAAAPVIAAAFAFVLGGAAAGDTASGGGGG